MRDRYFTTKAVIILLLTVVAIGVTFHFPPLAQPLSYHDFADHNMILGIPNFWNVVTNLGFLWVGFLGLRFLFSEKSRDHFVQPIEKLPYFVLFIAVVFVTFGSSYYHWNPNNSTLIFDRLPMSVAFAALTAALIGEYINFRLGRWLLFPLIILGVFSVCYWAYTESIGAGDLRLYFFMQFYPFFLILFMLAFFRGRYWGARYLMLAFAWYAIAKVLEVADKPVYQLTHQIIGGHPLKHLAAAVAIYYLYRYLQERRIDDTVV